MLSAANPCRRGRFIPEDAFDHGNVQKAQRKEPFAVAKTFTGSVTTVSPTPLSACDSSAPHSGDRCGAGNFGVRGQAKRDPAFGSLRPEFG